MDGTMYRLLLLLGGPSTPSNRFAVRFLWQFPPATPSSSSAWVGLFAASGGGWRFPCERLKWKMITKDLPSGQIGFTEAEIRNLGDGEYVCALFSRELPVATSRRFSLVGGALAHASPLAGLARPCDDTPLLASARGARQRSLAAPLAAGVGANGGVSVELAQHEEPVADERCYFEVPLVEVLVVGDSERSRHTRLITPQDSAAPVSHMVPPSGVTIGSSLEMSHPPIRTRLFPPMHHRIQPLDSTRAG